MIVPEAAMLRQAAGAHESNASFEPPNARQAAALVIVAAGFVAMGAAVVLRLMQLQSD